MTKASPGIAPMSHAVIVTANSSSFDTSVSGGLGVS